MNLNRILLVLKLGCGGKKEFIGLDDRMEKMDVIMNYLMLYVSMWGYFVLFNQNLVVFQIRGKSNCSYDVFISGMKSKVGDDLRKRVQKFYLFLNDKEIFCIDD